MLSTAPAPASDVPTDVPFANLERLQDDALQTIHKVMLYLTETITERGGGVQEGTPPDSAAEDPAQARTTTQRIRLCLQAAREILRFTPPCEADDGAAPPSPVNRGTVVSGAQRTRAGSDPAREASSKPPEAWQGRMPCAAPRSEAEPEANHRGLQDRNLPLTAPPTQPTTTLLAAAGAGASRLGERLSPSRDSSLITQHSASQDSGLSTHDSQTSAPPLDSSLITQHSASQDSGLSTHDSPAPAPAPAPTPPPSSVPSVPSVQKPPLPPRPEYFTHDEFNQIIAIMSSERDLLTPALYNRIQEWNAYAIPAGLSPALGITLERLESRNPHNPANQRASPTQ